MPSWYIKAAIQGALSQLPNAQRYNRFLQRYITRSLTLTEPYFLRKWQQAERHLTEARRHTNAPVQTSLELGTGWFPIVPLGLALGGSTRVYTVDRQSLLDKPRLLQVLHAYRRALQHDKIQLTGALAQVNALLSLAPSATAEQLLDYAGISTLIADARALPLPPNRVDLICSNNTFEHIPRDVLADILREFRRVLSPTGIMSHHIDLADHYAHFDSRISVYNFLRFSERRWRLFNNELQFQNRLRISDYRNLHHEAGFVLLREESLRKAAAELSRFTLAPEFSRYAPEDLLVFDTWLASKAATSDDEWRPSVAQSSERLTGKRYN